jgi:hypothetical protein
MTEKKNIYVWYMSEPTAFDPTEDGLASVNAMSGGARRRRRRTGKKSKSSKKSKSASRSRRTKQYGRKKQSKSRRH